LDRSAIASGGGKEEGRTEGWRKKKKDVIVSSLPARQKEGRKKGKGFIRLGMEGKEERQTLEEKKGGAETI